MQRSRGISISGPILKEKANFFASEFNIPNFECRLSWIRRFKVRHNIVTGNIRGKSLSVNKSDVRDWLEKVWPNLRGQYTDEQIFNADETGLFYRLTPDKTLKFKGETCADGKLSKERITVMVATNISGSVKRQLLVIGKSQYPRCFKRVRSLPVDYKSNRRAWMTLEIFEEWVRSWDRELTKEKKMILLLVDNCPAHIEIQDLKNITLVFLPPDTTSVLQPMDQGIIRALKTNFRKNLVLKLIANVDERSNSDEKHYQISVLDAILMIYDSWSRITQQTIFNCYKHAGFSRMDGNCSSKSIDLNSEEENVALSTWVRNMDLQLSVTEEELEQYVDIDNNVTTCKDLSDNTIIQDIIAKRNKSDDEDEPEIQDVTVSSTPTVSEALKAANILNKFVYSEYDDDNVKTAMSHLFNVIRNTYTMKKQ